MCQFGAPWKKDASLLVVRGSWLALWRGAVAEGTSTPSWRAALLPKPRSTRTASATSCPS
eukprot:3253951-Pyramimonas_sp.AAC.1